MFQGRDLKLINNRNVLSFSATDRHLGGIYECIAMNGVGEPAVKQITLKITCKYQNYICITLRCKPIL